MGDLIKKLTPASGHQVMIEYRESLMTVPCRTCNAKINEHCRTGTGGPINDPWQWHASRREDAQQHTLTGAQILRAFGVSPRQK